MVASFNFMVESETVKHRANFVEGNVSIARAAFYPPSGFVVFPHGIAQSWLYAMATITSCAHSARNFSAFVFIFRYR